MLNDLANSDDCVGLI